MTDLEKFIEAWPLCWHRYGNGNYVAILDSEEEIVVSETGHGVQVRCAGSLVGYERMPGVLLAVKRNLLEEGLALRQRLEALDGVIELINLEES